MKKFVLSLTFIVLCVGLFGQTIPNYEFESWTNNEPDNWDTSNDEIMGVVFNTVSRVDTDVYSGDYAIEATTVTESIYGENVTLPGVITLGEFILDVASETASIEGGIEFPHRPDTLNGYFKSAPAPDDTARIIVGLSKWDDAAGERDTIGFGGMNFPSTFDTWTEFNIPIEWSSTEVPDSMNIVIASSARNDSVFITGSSITVDSLWFGFPEQQDIIAVETLADITVDYGTAFGDIPLPDSVEVTLDDSSTDSLGVNWLEGSYDGNTQGTYPIEGELILTSGIANPDNLMAEVNVIVDEPMELDIIEVETLADITVDYGT
ncbi:MAG: PCMD domain-containing protein, partial [Bacteroidota bacterium]